MAWVAEWVAGLVDNDDGVSSLARLEAADEVWEIAATLQSTKRRHRHPPALYRTLLSPPFLPSGRHPRVSFRALYFFSLPLFTHQEPRRALLAPPHHSSSSEVTIPHLPPLTPLADSFATPSILAPTHTYTVLYIHLDASAR